MGFFYDRRFLFEVSPKDYTLRLHFPPAIDLLGRYSQHNLPLWFTRLVDSEIPQILNATDKKRISKFRNQIMSLIHVQPYQINNGAPIVQNYTEICSRPVVKQLGNLKFVKLELPTVEEAKNRAVCLALLTCNTYLGSGSFVRFFTGADFNKQQYLQGSISYLWRV